eukprot:5757647-Pyramimonas_sp.AAC.1
MSVLRVATRPVMDRNACFLDNDDLGQLGAASPTRARWCPSPLICGPYGTHVCLVGLAGLAAPWSSTGPLPRTAIGSSWTEAA